jgi:hypothetical protein
MKKIITVILVLISYIQFVDGQKKKAVTLNGYVTVMETVQKSMFDSVRGDFNNQNLIHNRLNFKAFAGDHLSFALEVRNRLFTGSVVSSSPDYAEMIGTDQGLFDLSWNIVDQKSYFLNTTVDRYWADYNNGKFQARIGRQRINWGQTLVWNPNDIFNPYSVFDVDYIERPGCDAVRLQYFPSAASALEFAVKGDADNNVTAAGLYRFNKWGYDFQVLAGYAGSHDLVAGAGWSGAIGSISFRGEASWFKPAGHYSDSTGRGLFTIGLDKVFTNNSMFQVQVMFCNDPQKPDDFSSFYKGTLSARDLAFSKFSAFAQGTYAATALMNLSLSVMWLPDLKGYFIGPSFDYSLAENLDFSLIWQYFTSRMNGVHATNNMGFLRLKYSF